MNDRLELFQQRVNQYKQANQELEGRDRMLSWSRILLFLVCIVAFVYFANAREGGAVLVSLGVLVIAFPLLVKYHNKIKRQMAHIGNLAKVNQEEVWRLENQLSQFESGASFLKREHPYTGDLDIFGKHSLFQLINRSGTVKGKAKLAGWLMEPSGRSEVQARQQAVKELAEDLDWCQNMQAYSKVSKANEEDTDTLINWVSEPPAILNKKIYLAAARIMPMISVAALFAYFLWDVSGFLPLGVFLVNILILWSTAEVASATHKKTTKGVEVLTAYVGMIERIEGKEFIAKLNQKQQDILKVERNTASSQIRKLQSILENFDSRGNVFYHVLNVILLLDVNLLLRAEQWKEDIHGDLLQWFDAVSTIEALVSIAAFSYAHPHYIFPEISETPYVFATEELGHCLIDAQKRVPNSFSMEGKGAINIITGSNMSGKSTFLRTVGVSTVMALMGAPVAAKSLRLSEMQLFTSMRTQDNLEESVSSFYAELQRLRQLLDYLKNPERPVMFMLDEILKGTNSQDRHHGAASLVKQLSQLDACGFVSTHDLELGALESQLEQVKNYSFTSTIEQDEIYFDYKIHDGICKSFNASKLMAKMGIAVEE